MVKGLPIMLAFAVLSCLVNPERADATRRSDAYLTLTAEASPGDREKAITVSGTSRCGIWTSC